MKRKRIVHLHIDGQVIRMNPDHPLYIEGQGWVNASDMPGAKSDGEEVAPPPPSFPITGFTGDTPLLTPEGLKKIKDIKAGDYIVMPKPLDPERN